MKCLKCSRTLSGKQTKYCSERCGKLYLKSQYKKRNREKVNAYARKYRKQGVRHLTTERRKTVIRRLGGKCLRCGTEENIDVHHIKPPRFGGTNSYKNLMLFCKPCHRLWHKMFDNQFWKI